MFLLASHIFICVISVRIQGASIMFRSSRYVTFLFVCLMHCNKCLYYYYSVFCLCKSGRLLKEDVWKRLSHRSDHFTQWHASACLHAASRPSSFSKLLSWTQLKEDYSWALKLTLSLMCFSSFLSSVLQHFSEPVGPGHIGRYHEHLRGPPWGTQDVWWANPTLHWAANVDNVTFYHLI